MRTCSKCLNSLEETEFYFANKQKSYRRPECKQCHITISVKRNQRNKNKAQYRRRKFQLKAVGTTPEEYQVVLEKQNGKCLICHTKPPYTLCADHNHATGKFRALLCRSCNQGLGLFKDSRYLLNKAIQYLEMHDG